MPTTQAKPSSPRILIVEDDKSICNACHMLLKHYEFDVTVATTLAEARRHLSNNPDLIILDLSLPDGDGMQLLEKIRTGGLKIQVFILTGDTSKETERKIRRWMPDRFFCKPLNFIEILEAIHERFEPAAPPEAKVVNLFDVKKPAA